ncbi:MAG: A24 family peptidase C-terminal domain-containing protein [Nitrososphaerota archaeon]|nr:A24 family peptidase C-terminal domain-containing protein [Nitrososphaerota archaeon]
MAVKTMQAFLEAVRVGSALFSFLYASWSDYKTREVSNSVWILFAPPAFALTFSELLLFNLSALPFFGLCFGLTAAFAIILFYAGGFGGADAKALMCLALALPFHPQELFSTPLSGEISPFMQRFFPLTVFSNAVILAALTAVYLLIHNFVRRWRTGRALFEGEQKTEAVSKKILVLLTGYKVSIGKVKEKWHLYPLEDVEKTENGVKRKLVVFPKDEGRNAIVERLEAAFKNGEIQEKIWATPGLPMLVFMTVGLVIALLYGDIVWNFVRFLLG